MKKQKKHRTFKAKLKHWPSHQENGVTHVYPASTARITQVATRDMARFEREPSLSFFVRPYIVGEWAGCPLPADVDLSQVTHVYVQKLNETQLARIALTGAQADSLQAMERVPQVQRASLGAVEKVIKMIHATGERPLLVIDHND